MVAMLGNYRVGSRGGLWSVGGGLKPAVRDLSRRAVAPFPDGTTGRGGHADAMPNYRRVWVPGGTYFFTVTLLERKRRLLVEHIGVLRSAFRAAHAARPFETLGVVILPGHLHAVWRLPEGDADYATRWRQIKSGFSRRLAIDERRSSVRVAKGERGIWQRRYWEHLIADEDDLRHHLDYLHYNPVKHGHVQRVRDWPYSSFHREVRLGRYPIDWAGDLSDRGENTAG